MTKTKTSAGWEKLGRILEPKPEIDWLSTFAGPSFALEIAGTSLVRVYVTGRDTLNRSRIGWFEIDMQDLSVRSISPEPVLELGRRGTFDENGTGYPCIVPANGKLWMYYVGWVPSVLVPFQNDIGLAVSDDGLHFQRVSEAPIVPRNNADCLSLGSVSVAKDGPLWRMWYTSFVAWGAEPSDSKHYYHIKYAESNDGVDWQRADRIAVTYRGGSEYVLCRPSVIKLDGHYHMWYCYRGRSYKIGYAHSSDGINWTRRDDLAGIDCSVEGWDNDAICYPHCFMWQDQPYLLYNGNDYGKTGLGIAKLKSKEDLQGWRNAP